jgi:hypothetical protein
MKVKFVKVWDDLRWGYVKHIVLQVEPSDTFLTEENFNPGYKFIITAQYKQVGAAGGHSFNPYYGERVRKVSRAIDATESDVLGFYLTQIKDIYDIPQELYTDTFWGVVRTDGYGKERDREDLYSDSDSYYKVLHTGIYNSDELHDIMLDAADGLPGELGENLKKSMIETRDHLRWLDKLSENESKSAKEKKSIRFAIIDKKSLECVSDKWSTSAQRIVADYLWCPCDELPEALWEQVCTKNEFGFERIYKTSEDQKIL